MKYILIIFVFIIFSCDDFERTNIFFTSDKYEYSVGDTIKLKVNITSDKEKKIRFYKNFKNLTIGASLSFNDTIDGKISESKTVNGIKEMNIIKNEDEIETYYISASKPFVKTFNGIILEDSKNFKINFKEYGLRIIIDKESYFKSNSFGFTGLCVPINASFSESYEDYIDYYPIKLKSGSLGYNKSKLQITDR